MTVVVNMHETSFIFMTCLVVVIMKVSCQSYAHFNQVKCYPFYNKLSNALKNYWHLNKIFDNANVICYQKEIAVARNQVKIFLVSCFINTLTFISIDMSVKE